MAKVLYVVFTRPAEGQEPDYNRWYDEQHLGDVLKVPGFVAAQRFQVVGDNAMPAPYLAIYEVETEDPEGIRARLEALAGSAAMPVSPAMDMERVAASVFRPITERRIA
ncbi:DUF4286 family protein [Solimonas soli]|jgi:hypothetical protein|uniref:DUF4286 family protein n=1 Tax=Solimonas soli TaxID=413479 RepID=UPI0004B778C1|nr:DUF4286 family protein [Solimonas soli]